jgi:hypothetical protein
MRMRFRHVTRVGFAAAVAVGLSFGAQSALAGPAQASACNYDPQHGEPGISCQVSANCEGVCWYSGMWVDGFCGFDKCCVCPW